MMSRARDTNLVLARRKELGMHIMTLAKLSLTHASLISNVEGGFCPKPATMGRIAEALKTTPELLWPDEFEAPGE